MSVGSFITVVVGVVMLMTVVSKEEWKRGGCPARLQKGLRQVSWLLCAWVGGRVLSSLCAVQDSVMSCDISIQTSFSWNLYIRVAADRAIAKLPSAFSFLSIALYPSDYLFLG